MLATLHPLLLPLMLGGGGAPGPELVNIQPTFGHLGAPRPKTGMLPGDTAHVRFDVKGLKADKEGKVAYSIALVITDAAGKVIFGQKPFNATAQRFFGGDLTPAAVRVDIPLDSKPGPVYWKVTVADRTTGGSTTLKGAGKILPFDFGLVQVGTFADPEATIPTSALGVVGERLTIGFSAVGFGRGKDKQPDLKVTLNIRDERGNLTLANPLTGYVTKDVAPDAPLVPMQFGLSLDRPGRFTVELTATCRHCGKTATVHLPVRIMAAE